MITEKQSKYLGSLLKDYPHKLNKEVSQLTKKEASALIGFLLKKTDVLDETVKNLFEIEIEPESAEPKILPGNLFPIDDDETLPF